MSKPELVQWQGLSDFFKAKRGRGVTHWKKAADEYQPSKYRVLCHNCQFREKMRLGLNAQSNVV